MTTSYETPTVFGTSATDSQGSALCRQLLELDWKVQSTAQDLVSPSTKALQTLGVELTLGN